MTDGSETRYSPGIRAAIEKRWQAAEIEGNMRLAIAQDDIQILLEGLATQERSLLAATARIAELEQLRQEQALHSAKAVVSLVAETRQKDRQEWLQEIAALHDARVVESARLAEIIAERDLARGLAQRRRSVLVRLRDSGIIPEGELLRAIQEEIG